MSSRTAPPGYPFRLEVTTRYAVGDQGGSHVASWGLAAMEG